MKALENIQRIRSEKRISQAEMAERLGIAQNNYGKIERGITELSVERLYKIANILSTTPAKLLELDYLKLEEIDEGIEDENIILKKRVRELEASMNNQHAINEFHEELCMGIIKIIDKSLEKLFEIVILNNCEIISEKSSSQGGSGSIGIAKIRNKGRLEEIAYEEYYNDIVNSNKKGIELLELKFNPSEINILFRLIFDSYDSNNGYTDVFFDTFIFSLMKNEDYISRSKYLKHFILSKDDDMTFYKIL